MGSDSVVNAIPTVFRVHNAQLSVDSPHLVRRYVLTTEGKISTDLLDPDWASADIARADTPGTLLNQDGTVAVFIASWSSAGPSLTVDVYTKEESQRWMQRYKSRLLGGFKSVSDIELAGDAPSLP